MPLQHLMKIVNQVHFSSGYFSHIIWENWNARRFFELLLLLTIMSSHISEWFIWNLKWSRAERASFTILWQYMAVIVPYFEQSSTFAVTLLFLSKFQTKEIRKTQQRKVKAETANPFLLTIDFLSFELVE